jgi:hypothetical protein
MIAECIIGADFLERFQVTVSFKEQCMYTYDDSGCRRHRFIGVEASVINPKAQFSANGTINAARNKEGGPERDDLAEERGYKDVREGRVFIQERIDLAGPSAVTSDDRGIQTSELIDKVEETSGLTSEQKTELLNDLLTYKNSFTAKPGRCKAFQYEFKVEPKEQLVGHSRPIPFAVRGAVRAQIKQLLYDKIIEPSDSSYLNPLTIVLREGKSPRICLDARKVNRWTMPDRTRVAPINELLQQFHRSKFITSIDLSSAFLQILLGLSSRKFTAFLHEGQIYQYTCTPYGFKNSLAAFVRALQATLGPDTCDYALAYVDDIVCHSKSFEQHMEHLGTVLRKLSEAGLTINAAKCKFCKVEKPFLGHIISERGVTPCPKRIEAILSYPPPKNQKQLRQFLGVCNYHHRFVVNYADYAAPLLVLLKKGMKWIWTPELQRAFRSLRARFAESIYLVHPDVSLPYTIHTDASGQAIGAVLMQTNASGETFIVSTASRVLNPAERRYSVAEQELLAIVFALQKFRIYMFGHELNLYTDNKALSFIHSCALTSNRISR